MKSTCILLPMAALLAIAGCSDNDKSYPKMNTAPTSTGASYTTQADVAVEGQLLGFDADGDALAFTAASQPAKGTLGLGADGSFTYTPNATFTGEDQFTFRVSDGKKQSSLATVNIVIDPQEVTFSSYSRAAFEQESTAEPLPTNGRVFEQDAVEETAYDDLLVDN